MVGRLVAAALPGPRYQEVQLRKVRTGKGTRLWKAQWGVIFNRRNRE